MVDVEKRNWRNVLISRECCCASLLIEEMRCEREETRKSMDKLTDAIIKLAESKR